MGSLRLREFPFFANCLMGFGVNYCRTLISVPIGGEMLESVGGQVVVLWLGGVLAATIVLFVIARWACLDYHWNWRTKI